MFITKKRFNAIVENTATLEKHMGLLLQDIAQFYPYERDTDNPYISKQTQVNGVRDKYKGHSSYGGNQILQRLVNLRVAFSIPNRLFLVKNPILSFSDEEVDGAKEFLNRFISFNGLDSSIPRDLAKEGELQGQVVVRLLWDEVAKLPRILYYPWSSTSYTVEAFLEYDINSPLILEYHSDAMPIKVEDSLFSFIAFNDELGIYEGHPTCGPILKVIENLDADLQDWRKLNHLFGHPTPHFKCETQEQAEAINAMITSTGWKVGTALATNSEFGLKGPTGQEGNLLMLSIQTNIKIISAHTGVGPHFLGFANVMSNRATAESMGEPTEVVLHSEIASWKRFYIDLFNKAIRLRNSRLNRPVMENAVHPKLVPLTDRQWSHIRNIFMPAAAKTLVSRETFLDSIPDVDVTEELTRIKDEEENMPAPKAGEDGDE